MARQWLLRAAGVLGLCGLAGCSGDDRTGVEVAIISPRQGAHITKGSVVLFHGEGLEDGAPLPPASLSWSSDRDGALGSGQQLQRGDLSLGAHEITLTVQGVRGTGSATIAIEVVPPSNRLPPAVEITSPTEGAQLPENHAVTLAGKATDEVDGVLPGYALTWISSRDGVLGNGAQLVVPALSVGKHVLTLNAVDGAGLTGSATVAVEVLHAGENLAPVVTLASPADGASFVVGSAVHLAGSAIDPEDGPLPGGALRWTSSKDGVLGSGSDLQVGLTQGVHVVTLAASDSQGKTSQLSVTVSVNPVGNQPPVVTISSPTEGEDLEEGAAVPLRGAALDPEQGALGGAALVWSSDLAGTLGTGTALDVSSLGIGWHRLTLTATDAGGAVGTASVHLRIHAKVIDLPPTARIDAPADGAAFDRGQTVDLAGAGTDPEDGALHGAALSWSSDRDGPLGNGEHVSITSLSVGQHRVTLTVTDSHAQTGQAAISLTIRPGQPQNLPPTARLAGPNQVMARSSATFDGSASSDADGTIVRYLFDFGDGSPAQDGASASATHVFASDGDRVVKLTVTDNGGASASTTLAVHVTAFARSPVVVEDSRDLLGATCALGFAPGGQALVAYRNSTHRSVRLARQQPDGSFVIETVEGLGLDIGGDSGESVDLAVDGAGVPRLAYLRKDSAGQTALRYAWWTGSSWSLVSVAAASPGVGLAGRTVALALNPVQQERPEILFRKADGVTVALARCDAACAQPASWTIEDVHVQSSGYASNAAWAADLKIAPDGSAAAVFSVAYYDPSYYPRAGLLYRHRLASGGWEAVEAVSPVAASGGLTPTPARAAFDGAANPLVVYAQGVAHRLHGTWRLSQAETSGIGYFDIAFDATAGSAFLLNRHGSEIELIGEDQGSYWVYSDLGPQDEAWPELALDPQHEPRACFARDGNVMLY